MSQQFSELPNLPLGDRFSVLQTDVNAFGDEISRAFPGLNAYDPIGPAGTFRSKSAVLKLPLLTVVSAALTPTYVDRKCSDKLTLMLPITGQNSFHVGRHQWKWGKGVGAAFLPITDEANGGFGSYRSQIMLQLDSGVLQRTAQAMFPQIPRPDLQLSDARVLPFTLAGIEIDQVLRQLMPMMDLYADQPSVLVSLGLQDAMYRLAVSLLRPDLVESTQSQTNELEPLLPKRRLVDMACDQMMDNLDQVVSITELAITCGVSVRALQYAFQQRLGCTPKEWLQRQRLMRAQAMLQSSPYVSIMQVAMACGFPSASLFAQRYREAFGVLPSLGRGKLPS